jgi:hypothetical protein
VVDVPSNDHCSARRASAWIAISKLSHELAGTLNGLGLFRDLVACGSAGSSIESNYGATLESAIDSAVSVVRTLEAVSRLKARIYEPYLVTTPVRTIIDAVRKYADKFANGKLGVSHLNSSDTVFSDTSLLELLAIEMFELAMQPNPNRLLLDACRLSDSHALRFSAQLERDDPASSLEQMLDSGNPHAILADFIASELRVGLSVSLAGDRLVVYEARIPTS